ncbi:MAG: 6-bladed beta-propeller [Bacteroidetes bacterium]|jgi:hypothetical protein|nr:6-bladed beta-propeller [Bacteroidota bacterium]
MKSTLFFISLLFLLFSHDCCNSQTFSLDLNQALKIGEEFDESANYMFGNISSIQVSSREEIYVVDRSSNSIKVYKPNGEYINQIGMRGRGPGEFSEITHFSIDHNDNLIVLDRHQSRVSIFSPDSQLIGTFPIDLDEMVDLQFIYPAIKTDDYLIGFRSLIESDDTGNLLHEFDKNFSPKNVSHLNVFHYLFDRSKTFEQRISTSMYYSTLMGDNVIAITPSVYTGVILYYHMTDQSVEIAGSLDSDFYTLYNWEDRTALLDDKTTGFATKSGFGNNFIYKRKGANFGLVANDKFLLQFITYFEGQSLRTHLNIYSIKGELLTSSSLVESPVQWTRNNKYSAAKPMYLDDKNRLYVANSYYDNSYPAVVIYETNLDELLY